MLVQVMTMNHRVNLHVPVCKKCLMLLQQKLLHAAGHLLPQKRLALIGQNCLEAISGAYFLVFRQRGILKHVIYSCESQ